MAGYVGSLLRRELGRTGWPTMLPGVPGPHSLRGFFGLLNVAGGDVHHQLGELVGIAWAFHLWHSPSVPMAPPDVNRIQIQTDPLPDISTVVGRAANRSFDSVIKDLSRSFSRTDRCRPGAERSARKSRWPA